MNGPARRLRPKLATTLDPEVDAALRAQAEATGLPIGRVADAAIRIGLGMIRRASLPTGDTSPPTNTTATA